tara:strand:- start:72 stop:1784 length:1713 start_codon:yes stop_codon:yes gene_type:complete
MLFQEFLTNILLDALKAVINKKKILITNQLNNEFNIEIPQNSNFGDLSTNIAMVNSRLLHSSPGDLAENIVEELSNIDVFKKLEIKNPGFINIFFEDRFWHKQLDYLMKLKGYNYNCKKKNICLEFVSANPTGLMHIGHARGAVLGDTLASILELVGHNVTREYYINDAGEQIKRLEKTILFYLKKNTLSNEFTDDLYPGDYLKKISKKVTGDSNYSIENKNVDLKKMVVDFVMDDIKKDLKSLRIKFDNFASEKKIADKKNVENLKNKLKELKLAYFGYQEKPKKIKDKDWTKEKHFIFSSKKFGDDCDRALIKPNNEITYFMSDIIYHQSKLDRNYDLLLNIWGVDHFGYIKRLKSALTSLNPTKEYEFEIKLTALVNLMKNKKHIKMSKRSGNYITIRDVIEEVGVDVLRFMMISRNADKKIDFDFEIFLQKNKDNPVFYVQYAYARCKSILKISKQFLKKDVDFEKVNLSYLVLDEEKLLIKILANYYNVINSSAKYFEPHRITNYLYELSRVFHSYWGLGNQDKKKRILVNNFEVSLARLALIKTISQIINDALNLLKINCPESM